MKKTIRWWMGVVVVASLGLLAGCGRVMGRIDSISPNDPAQPLRAEVGQTVKLTMTFTNIGSKSGTLIPRAAVWDSIGRKVKDYERPPIFLAAGQQFTVEWEHKVEAEGEFLVQFSLWKDPTTLVAQWPQQPQKLLLATAPRPTGKFAVGDRVRVTASVNVRTGAGTSHPKVTHVNYPGSMPPGSMGKIAGGPQQADGYVWWRVEFDNGVVGWCIEDALAKVSSP